MDKSPERIEQIARITHEANRAYCLTLGDKSQVPWDEAPDWQKDSARNGVAFIMAECEVHANVQHWLSHSNWMLQKQQEGWKYGPVKDAEKKEHPCMVDFFDLPIEQQMKDKLFVSIVKAFAYS